MSAGAPPALHAVLLDLDGTLVDTVDVWHAAYLRLADELGADVPADLWSRVAGRSMHASLEVFGAASAAHEPDVLVARLVALAAAGIGPGSGWRWMPGARELVELLRAAAPVTSGTAHRAEGRPALALVTSAWRGFTLPLLTAALGGAAAVDATFDAIVCGDDVAAGKPDPDSHLRAAALVGVAPEACLVVEDSPTGVAAAEAAGMVALVVPHAGPVDPARGRALRDDLVGLTFADVVAIHARLRSDMAGSTG